MNYLKLSGLFVLAMVATSALTASALATTATSPAGTLYTGNVAGTSEGHVVVTGPLGIKIQCEGAVEGSIESHGNSVTGKGKGEKWSYANCTNGYQVQSLATGTLEVHALGNGVGTVTSTGTEGLVKTPLGFDCVYRTNATDLGTVTDSSVTGGKATIHINASLPRTGGSSLCGSIGHMTGAGIVNTPATIYID